LIGLSVGVRFFNPVPCVSVESPVPLAFVVCWCVAWLLPDVTGTDERGVRKREKEAARAGEQERG